MFGTGPPYPDRFHLAAKYAAAPEHDGSKLTLSDDLRLLLYALYQQVRRSTTSTKERPRASAIAHRSVASPALATAYRSDGDLPFCTERLSLWVLGDEQATEGPCTEPKPWGWEVIKSAKWTSWNKLGKMAKMEAMR